MVRAVSSILPGGGLRRRGPGSQARSSALDERTPQQEWKRVTLLSIAALPVLALVATVLRRIQHQHTPYLREAASGGLQRPDHPPPRAGCGEGEEGSRVISMSLYGSRGIYDVGALRNARLAKEHMPGWRVRVYANLTELKQGVIVELGELGAEIVDVSNGHLSELPPMMWRFAVASDPSVSRYIVRDADARIGEREAACVEAWVKSCENFHVIRDHPSHSRFPVGGGLWGGTRDGVPALLDIARNWLVQRDVPGADSYLWDMEFLRDRIWPLMKKAGVLQHDSFSCTQWGGSPFPVQRRGNKVRGFEFVGAKFDHVTEKPFSVEDASALLKALPEPFQCVHAPALPGGWRH